MDSDTHIKHPRIRLRSEVGGFTLVEILVASTLSALVLAAILSSYLFLGRNLTRLAYQQQLEAQSRLALETLAEDARMTRAVSAASDTSLTLTVQVGTSSSTTVVYTYDSSAKTLSRTQNSTTRVLLRYVTVFDFSYYDFAHSSDVDLQTLEITTNSYSSLAVSSIRQISMSYTCLLGTLNAGTQTRYAGASSRVVLRNTPLLY